MLISVIATEFDEEYDYSQPTNMFVSRTKQTQTTNNDGETQENSNGQNPEESKQVKNPDEDILPNFLQGLKIINNFISSRK